MPQNKQLYGVLYRDVERHRSTVQRRTTGYNQIKIKDRVIDTKIRISLPCERPCSQYSGYYNKELGICEYN
jgi:hypothetical protein